MVEGNDGQGEGGRVGGDHPVGAHGDERRRDTEPGGSEGGGGTMVWGKPAELIEFDPQTSLNGVSWQLLYLAYETLVEIGPELEIQPGLAESWDTPSDTEYVFHLRPGVTFSNGRAMTADDVVQSFERLRRSGAGRVLGRPARAGGVDRGGRRQHGEVHAEHAVHAVPRRLGQRQRLDHADAGARRRLVRPRQRDARHRSVHGRRAQPGRVVGVRAQPALLA